jgi:folate-binding protein YgfZ
MSGLDAAVLSQYHALTTGAGFVALPNRTLLEITGADRATFINSFCTNDVKRLTAGQGCEAFFTNHQGKTIGHGLIFAEADALIFETTPNQAEPLTKHLDRFVISERIEFHDRSSQWSEIFVGGHQAGELLKSLTAGVLPEAVLSHQGAAIGGASVALRRVAFTQGPGWLVQVESTSLDAVLSALGEAGFVEASAVAFEMCRVEAGWPWFGEDISEENLPQEIDRNEQAISFKKGCYLGQETVARLDALGHVNRLLVRLKLEGETIPARGAPVYSAEKEVGRISSAARSPRHGRPLALALVRRAATLANSPLRCNEMEATVLASA